MQFNVSTVMYLFSVEQHGLSLTTDNFTFRKTPIAQEPEESIRNASEKLVNYGSPKTPTQNISVGSPKVQNKTPKQKSLHGSSGENVMKVMKMKKPKVTDIKANVNIVTTGTALSNEQCEMVKQLTTSQLVQPKKKLIANAMQRIIANSTKKRRVGPAEDVQITEDDFDDSGPQKNFNGDGDG